MTEKQRKLLFVLAKQRGMDNELLHSYVETQTGKQSITEVTTQEAKVLIDGLQEKKQTAKDISQKNNSTISKDLLNV